MTYNASFRSFFWTSAFVTSVTAAIMEFSCGFNMGLCSGWAARSSHADVSWIWSGSSILESDFYQNVSSHDGASFMYVPKANRTNSDNIWSEITSQSLKHINGSAVDLLITFWYLIPRWYGSLALQYRNDRMDRAPRKGQDSILWIIRANTHKDAKVKLQWYRAEVALQAKKGGSLVFRATFGRFIDTFGLDDVNTNALPPGLLDAQKSVSCKFETSFCGWTNYFDSNFHLKQSETIKYAVVRHSGAENVHPVYGNYSPRLGSVPITASAALNTVFRFRYYFSDTGVSFLRLHQSQIYDEIVLWKTDARSNNIGQWITVVLPLCISNDTVLRFTAAINDEGSEVRLADFDYHGEFNTSMNLPHYCPGISCTFEESMCGWMNEYSVSSRWTRRDYLDNRPDAHGLFDLIAERRELGLSASVARLVSECIDIPNRTRFGTSQTAVVGDLTYSVKYFHENYSETYIAVMTPNMGTIWLPPGQAVRIVIEYIIPSDAITMPRIPLLHLENEYSNAMWSQQCPDYPQEPLITFYPRLLSASCTFDRNLCGWKNMGPQKFLILPGYKGLLAYGNTGNAAGALMLYSGSGTVFGPLRSPNLGGGPRQLFFFYRADDLVQSASLFLDSAGTFKSVWVAIQKPINWNRWMPATVSYCTESNHTLEFIVQFKKYNTRTNGFWIDDVTLNNEEEGQLELPECNSESLLSLPTSSFQPDRQLDRFPDYAACQNHSYLNVTCSFERNETCSWRSADNGTSWVAAEGPFGSVPFIVPGSLSDASGRFMAFNRLSTRDAVLWTDYIGPRQTRLRFVVFLFGPGLQHLRLYATTMSDHISLWNSRKAESGIKPSAKRWQTVELDICIKAPFQIVFEISAQNSDYVVALDNIELIHECEVLSSNVVCQDPEFFSPLEEIQYPSVTVTETLLSPSHIGTLNCSFDNGDLCGWVGGDSSITWTAVPSNSSNGSVAFAWCKEIGEMSAVAFLISSRASCTQHNNNLCIFKAQYKGSRQKVIELEIELQSENASARRSLWRSGPNEFPEWQNVTIDLSNISAFFWLTLKVQFLEDESSIELDNLQFTGENAGTGLTAPPPDDPGYTIQMSALYGNLFGAVGIAVIFTIWFCYRRRLRQNATSFKLAHPDIPDHVIKEFEIPSTAISLLNEALGESRFCRVGLARLNVTDWNRRNKAPSLVAVKFLADPHTLEDERCFLTEIATFMIVGHHRNVVALFGVVLKGRLLTVMEYCANGSLLIYLQNPINYCNIKANNEIAQTENEVQGLVDIALQVAEGMKFLADRDIIHRDLAARNILLDCNLVVKISDFGLARASSQYVLQRSKVKLPLGWMAPETLVPLEGRYTDRSDVWSFGVVVWECFTFGQPPYSQQLPQGLHHEHLHQFLLSGNRLHLPAICPQWLSSLVHDCWLTVALDRPSFSQIVLRMDENVVTTGSKL